MPFRPKRHPELNRLYAAVGLAVLIWFIVRAYKVLSLQVSAGVDAPSRWALPAVGLANTLAIATLLFIVARSLAKLYFERRKGILGARIRTRLVLALFGVCLAPSLMLFLIGRNFISKNVARWFLPETQQVIRDGARISEAFQAQQAQRLAEGLKRLPPEETAPLAELRGRAGLDLLARAGGASIWLRVGCRRPCRPWRRTLRGRRRRRMACGCSRRGPGMGPAPAPSPAC